MKIICLKKHLKETINLCERITGKNLSLPILSNILISSGDKVLKFTSTNLELGIDMKIPAKIIKEGNLAIPGSVINNFLSNLPGDENITLESKNDNLFISTKDSSTLIKGQSTEDFPSLPVVKSSNSIMVSISDFISGLKSVWYSCSASNIKPEISSVFMFLSKSNNITFTATDSFRLAEKKIGQNSSKFDPILIPYRAIAEILRVFDGREGEAKISLDKNQLSIELSNINFISRLTEGVFPDYQQIIPSKFITTVTVDKNIFSNFLKTANIFSSKLNDINFNVEPKGKIIAIETSNTDIGEHSTKIPAEIFGKEIKITFNYRYVSECLQHIPSQKIVLRFEDENKPLLVSGVDDDTFRYLIMPMNSL